MANNPYVNKVQLADGTSLIDISDTTAVASDVLVTKYFYTASGQKVQGTNQGGSGDGYVWQDAQGYVHLSDEEGTQTTIDALTVTANGTYTASSGHAYSPVTVDVQPTLQSKSATPTESAQTISPDSGYDGLSSVSVGAISSTYVGSGITQRSSSDLTASGATVTVPSGYYSAQASKSVSSGTAGTPTATKGSVSNHSVSVTPSVTNSAGYISGGTKTGTAVSVSASELVSGTLSITSSGTKDVTNYASASVSAGTEGTPTASKGTVSNNSVSVTPSVTNSSGFITGGTHSGTAVTVSASELVSGTKSISENGTGIDVTNYASVDVAVPTGSATLVTKSITANGTYNASSDNADGYSSVTVNVSGGGGGGLVYEEGTWTPSEDISAPTISFQNAHTEAPVFVMMSDATGSYDGTTYTCQSFVYGDWEKAFGTTINPSTSSSQYALLRGVYRATNATAASNTGTIFASRTSAETYVNSSRFVPNIGSGYYWRTNRTYKWIAVWAPTT